MTLQFLTAVMREELKCAIVGKESTSLCLPHCIQYLTLPSACMLNLTNVYPFSTQQELYSERSIAGNWFMLLWGLNRQVGKLQGSLSRRIEAVAHAEAWVGDFPLFGETSGLLLLSFIRSTDSIWSTQLIQVYLLYIVNRLGTLITSTEILSPRLMFE